ncbi:MAG: four-carbon acid sugar kinase family protein [Desulfopila sp.]
MHPPAIAVIADDLTGGADTGVHFCPGFGPIYLSSGLRGTLQRDDLAGGGVALYTNSRHADPREAAEMVHTAYANIRHLCPATIYKKIDSCLRGNIGAEIDSLLLHMGARMSFVAPALPGQGRTTANDIHMIHGVPIAATETAADPLCPVNESRLSVLLQNQSDQNVGRVTIATVDKGVQAMAETVRQLGAAGCKHIAFDATRKKHLDDITHLAQSCYRDNEILLVGSAGLAASLAAGLADDMSGNTAAPIRTPRPRIDKWLLVCGSASATMARQVRALVEHTSWAQLKIEPERLVQSTAAQAEQYSRTLPAKYSFHGSLIVTVAAADSQTSATLSPPLILRCLAEATSSRVGQNRPQGLFLSGGDTADAVLERIHASGVVLHEEITSGLMLGRIAGGSCDNLPVVTKAGSFGNDNTLIQLIQRLR